MAKVLAKAEVHFSLGPRMRNGRYDAWLNGDIWELRLKDFERFFSVRAPRKISRQARRSLAARAKVRGLRVNIVRLVDMSLVVQAARKAS